LVSQALPTLVADYMGSPVSGSTDDASDDDLLLSGVSAPVDALYLLDEPTAGLHSADTDRLMLHLQKLVDVGNTVVVVELDMRVVAQADYVIDLGPGAGAAGGRIVATGTPAAMSTNTDSLTAPYLAAAVDLPPRRKA